MGTLSLDVVVTRGAVGRVAAPRARRGRRRLGPRHRGGRRSELVTYWRSCAKPFQVMPLLEAAASTSWAGATTSSPSPAPRTAASRSTSRSPRAMLASPRDGGGRSRLRPARAALAAGRRSVLREIGAAPDAPAQQLLGQARRDARARAHRRAGRPRATSARTIRSSRPASPRSRAGRASPVGDRAVRSRWLRRAWCSRSRSRRWRAPTRGSPTPPPRRRRSPLAHRARDADATLPRRRHRPLRLRAHRGDGRPRDREDRRRGRALAWRSCDAELGSRGEGGGRRPARPVSCACSRSFRQLERAPRRLPPRLAEFLASRVRNTRGEVVGECARCVSASVPKSCVVRSRRARNRVWRMRDRRLPWTCWTRRPGRWCGSRASSRPRTSGPSAGARRRGGRRAGLWVEELMLQSYLFAGFPRALNAAREWRRRRAARRRTTTSERTSMPHRRGRPRRGHVRGRVRTTSTRSCGVNIASCTRRSTPG